MKIKLTCSRLRLWRGDRSPRLGLRASPGDAVPVTVDNFVRAESDLYMRQLRQGRRRSRQASSIAASRPRSTIRP